MFFAYIVHVHELTHLSASLLTSSQISRGSTQSPSSSVFVLQLACVITSLQPAIAIVELDFTIFLFFWSWNSSTSTVLFSSRLGLDDFSINDNTTQRDETMDELRYRALKEKMAALKSLYASRHYSQCAKFGELLLSEIHDQVSTAINNGQVYSHMTPRHIRSTSHI